MARTSRVVLNRRAVDQVDLAIADGMHAVGRAVIDAADPPDATPFGEGLVTRGGVLTYAGPRKVDGWSLDGRQPKKPRGVKANGPRGLLSIIGFGFPARFQEFGTVHHGPQPFLTPAVESTIPRMPSIVRRAAAYRITRLRNIGRIG